MDTTTIETELKTKTKIKNINYNTVADFLYLVCDHSTDAVMASSTSQEAVNAIQLFSSRLQVRVVETHKPWISDDFKVTNFNNSTVHYTAIWKSGSRDIGLLNPEVATDEFVERRREIIRRLSFQDSLLIKVQTQMANTGYSNLFLQYADTIGYELHRCNPKEDYYTYAVQAYGIASGCDTASAYNELKLQLDNLAHVRMRNLGIYVKYRNLLNDAPGDRDSQRAVIQDSMNALVRNSSI